MAHADSDVGPVPDDQTVTRKSHPSGRRRPVVRWSIGVLLLLVIAIGGWVGMRGLLAKQQLTAALHDVTEVKSALASGDLPTARRAASTLTSHAHDAASLTGDPLWRATETVPWLGPNFSAVRVTAASVDTLATQVVKPLVAVAARVDPRTIAVKNGTVDLTPLAKAQPTVERAQQAFHRAEGAVDGIDRGTIVSALSSAVGRLQHALTTTGPTLDAVANSVRLLPGMLGADGPRNYLLLAQNPAELRATGGLVGALALIRADHGAISLVAQTPGTAIGSWPQQIAAIPAGTQGLYGPLIGRLLQDANLSPDFPLAAGTTSRMWTQTFGGTIDGVVTIDPVVLQGLLRATGPVALPTGETVAAGDAVRLLLSDVYRRYPVPADQDAFFASVASAVFGRVAAGAAKGTDLVNALAEGGQAHRILLWSAHPAEQKVLATTTLAGLLPASTARRAAIGVYLDDATGAKMDYYLTSDVVVASGVCRADRIPTTRVSVTLTNTAPADAATALPAYVTGAGDLGVPAGRIRTRVAVYGADGGLLAATTSGTSSYPTIAGTDAGRPVSLFTVELAPGESRTVSVDLLNVRQRGPGVSVAATPTLPLEGVAPDMGSGTRVKTVALDCAAAVK